MKEQIQPEQVYTTGHFTFLQHITITIFMKQTSQYFFKFYPTFQVSYYEEEPMSTDISRRSSEVEYTKYIYKPEILSSMFMIFFYLDLLQNDTIVTSPCMQYIFCPTCGEKRKEGKGKIDHPPQDEKWMRKPVFVMSSNKQLEIMHASQHHDCIILQEF